MERFATISLLSHNVSVNNRLNLSPEKKIIDEQYITANVNIQFERCKKKNTHVCTHLKFKKYKVDRQKVRLQYK